MGKRWWHWQISLKEVFVWSTIFLVFLGLAVPMIRHQARSERLINENPNVTSIKQASYWIAHPEKRNTQFNAGTVYIHRAIAYVHLGQIAEAEKDFATAREVEPKGYADMGAALSLAREFAHAGRHTQAIHVFETVLKDVPGKRDARQDYAEYLATTGNKKTRDGKKALDHARKLHEPGAKPDRYDYWVLSKALAEVAHFSEAEAAANKALELPARSAQADLYERQQIHALINLIKQGKAWTSLYY